MKNRRLRTFLLSCGLILCMAFTAACSDSSTGSTQQTDSSASTAVAEADESAASSEEISTEAEEGDFVDNIEDEVVTEGDDTIVSEEPVPLGPGSDSKTTTKTSTKKKTSKKTTKKAASSSKIVTRKQTKKTTTSKTTTDSLIVKVKTTVTTTRTKYKKGSNVLNITKKIKTTLKTTTTPVETGEMDITQAAKKADSKLIQRFQDEGYKYVVDTGLASIGLFSSRNHQLTLRYQSDVIYHELGHYLGYTTGKMDATDEFKAIYEAEKDAYEGSNKEYVIQDNYEYFAESYRDYVTQNAKLKSDRPKTYKYIKKVLAML